MSQHESFSVGLRTWRPTSRFGKTKRRRAGPGCCAASRSKPGNSWHRPRLHPRRWPRPAVKPWTGCRRGECLDRDGQLLRAAHRLQLRHGQCLRPGVQGRRGPQRIDGRHAGHDHRHERQGRVWGRGVLGPVAGAGRDRRLDVPTRFGKRLRHATRRTDPAATMGGRSTTTTWPAANRSARSRCGSSSLAAAPARTTASTWTRSSSRSAGTNSGGMNIDVTLSDEAQGTTIAFDRLGFLTGSLGADSFFPPAR